MLGVMARDDARTERTRRLRAWQTAGARRTRRRAIAPQSIIEGARPAAAKALAAIRSMPAPAPVPA